MTQSKRFPIVNSTRLIDALYYIDPDSHTDPDHARGVIVGVISTLTAVGFDFTEAINLVLDTLAERNSNPHRSTKYVISASCLPACWVADFTERANFHGVPMVD